MTPGALRDIAAAMKAQNAVLRAIAERIASQDANGTQHRENQHKLNNHLQVLLSEREGMVRAIQQIQTWMPEFSGEMRELKGQVESLQRGVTEGFRDDRRRLRELEDDSEGTQP